MKRRDVAIVGHYETKFARRSGRSILDIAGEAASGARALVATRLRARRRAWRRHRR